MPATDTLPRSVRVGYGSGSVATGAFGTVPGLMLLPYLTDSLGIAAILAGFIVFLPKAWDVILNPIAGRISDRTVDPRGPRRPWLLRAGARLAVAFALLFAAPEMATGLEALWVLVAFLACATAYAFFQVPYVAMPAEMTSSYDERTRLMTWRVAILAFTIMLAGATAPADPRRGRRPRRLPGDGPGDGGDHPGRRRQRLRRHPPTRRSAAPQPGAGSLRDQLRIVAEARDFRWLLTCFVIQALATGCMLAGVDYLASDVLGKDGAATILFICFVGPALLLTPVWSAIGTRIGKKRGYVAQLGHPRCRRAARGDRAGRAGRRSSTSPSCWSASGTPAARSSRWRCCPTRPRSTRGVPAPTGPASTPASGPPARPSASRSARASSPSCSRSAATGRRPTATSPSPTRPLTAITLGFSILPAALILLSLWWLRRYSLDAADGG